MISLDSAATEVFQILRSYDYTVMMYDDDGNQVYEPDGARRFFATPENLLVSIVDDGDNKSVRLYIGTSTDVADVLGLDQTLRSTATKYNMMFNLRRQGRDLKPEDFATRASVTESQGDKQMDLLEGMYGTTKSSYLKLENAKMIVRHSKKIDENITGSRGRHVDAIFIENAQGERFLFPSRQLSPARAMTQHVNHGGNFADQVGQQIGRMAQDYSALAQGSSYIGSNSMMLGESAQSIRETIRENMRDMRKCFERLSRSGGYLQEAQRIEEEATMLSENDGSQEDDCKTADHVKESLFVEGVDLDESVISAVVECLRKKNKKVGDAEATLSEDDESGAKGFIIAATQVSNTDANAPDTLKGYVGTAGLVQEKSEATTYDSKEEADAAAARFGAKVSAYNFVVKAQHAKAQEIVPVMTTVAGRKVSKPAWDKFVAGKLELSGTPNDHSERRFSNPDAAMAFKLRDMVAMVKDDSMLNLLSYVAERMSDDGVPGGELNGLRAIAKHALKITSPAMAAEGVAFNSEPLREFAEWINSFSTSRALAESSLTEMEDDEDHSDAVIHKSSEIDWVLKNFDAKDFLESGHSDWFWGDDSLTPEELTVSKAYIVKSLAGYLSAALQHNAGVEDEDMSQEAAELYPQVQAIMQSANYEITESDDLSRDDVVIPDGDDQSGDFEHDVTVNHDWDGDYIARMKTLSGLPDTGS